MGTILRRKDAMDALSGEQRKALKHAAEAVALGGLDDSPLYSNGSLWYLADHGDLTPDDAGRMALCLSAGGAFPDFDPDSVSEGLTGNAKHAAIHAEVSRFASEHGFVPANPEADDPWAECIAANSGALLVAGGYGVPPEFEPYNPE